jgi:hypothetical protein
MFECVCPLIAGLMVTTCSIKEHRNMWTTENNLNNLPAYRLMTYKIEKKHRKITILPLLYPYSNPLS